MDKRVETGREFWRAVLLAGGATAIPRWTLDPAPASPSTSRPSMTTSRQRCAGWPMGWSCRCTRWRWPRTRRCWRRCPASRTW